MPTSDQDSSGRRRIGRPSRRKVLQASGAAGLAGLAGCMGILDGSSTPTINIQTWQEYENLTDKIESRLDVEVDITKSTSSAKMFSAWNSGQNEQYDIAVPNNNYVPKMKAADLIDSVPEDTVSQYGDIYETFRGFADDQFAYDGSLYGVPIRFGWYGYAYDSRVIPEDHDASYDLLFGDEHDGKIIMYDNHFKAMSATALHLGFGDAFDGGKVTLSDDQIQEVKQALIDQKPKLSGYISPDPTFIKSFRQGNFVVGQSGRNEVVQMWTEGDDWPRMAVPQEGSLAWFEAAVVSKESENKDAAWQIVNEYIAPELGAELAKVGYSPSCNPRTQEHLSEEQNEMYGAIAPERLEAFIPFKAVENEDAWIDAWEEVKAA